MELAMSFFSDLILFTAGLVVVLLWITIFIVIGIEIYDGFKESDKDEEEDF